MTMVQGGVVVGYLSGGDTRIEFTRSIGAVTAHCFQTGIPLVGALPHISGPRIAAGRNHIVESFLASPGEWFFMVDDDMAFDGDVIERFLKVADPDERPIVGGLAFAMGRDGVFPTLFRLDETIKGPVRLTSWPLDEVVEVDATGAACLFVHRSVFERMAEHYPKPWQWFQETNLNGNTVGEDMTFCLRARSLGFPIIVDTSIKFGHVKPRVIDEDEFFRWVDGHKFVITGVSGTGYMARVMQFCRIACSHEEMFTEAGYRPNPFIRGEASWMAVPHLDRFSGYVLHVVRDPVETINWLVDVIEDTPYVREHAPDVLEYETPVERAMAWYLEWNRRIEPHAHRRVRVEDVSSEDMYDIVRYAGAFHAPWEIDQLIGHVPTSVLETPTGDWTWDTLPDGLLKTELEQLAKDYGYEPR